MTLKLAREDLKKLYASIVFSCIFRVSRSKKFKGLKYSRRKIKIP